jgi:hypothetical protein
MKTKLGKCICCGEPGKFSVVLAVGPNNDPVDMPRYYIPNDGVRECNGTPLDPSEIVPFCGTCMRAVEDNLRATILGLQAENGLLAIRRAKSN